MNELYKSPTFYAHVINGFLLLFAFIFLLQNYSEVTSTPYKTIVLTLLFALVIAIHGLSHLALQVYFNYNPIVDILKKD